MAIPSSTAVRSSTAEPLDPSSSSSLLPSGQNADYYSEVSSAKKSAWPSDVNIDSALIHSPPPVPEWHSDGLVDSTLDNVSSSQPVVTNDDGVKSPVKMLDPKFIAELEKHLGQKEASANTNPPNSLVNSSPSRTFDSIGNKVGTPVFGSTNSTGRSKQNESPGTSYIPALKPPPQSIKVSQKNSPLLVTGGYYINCICF